MLVLAFDVIVQEVDMILEPDVTRHVLHLAQFHVTRGARVRVDDGSRDGGLLLLLVHQHKNRVLPTRDLLETL
jgi:hypothetical protein